MSISYLQTKLIIGYDWPLILVPCAMCLVDIKYKDGNTIFLIYILDISTTKSIISFTNWPYNSVQKGTIQYNQCIIWYYVVNREQCIIVLEKRRWLTT